MRQTDRPRLLSIVARRLNGQVKLTVSDTGCGIDEKHLEHIFDPFFNTRSSGLGLGLAITRSIVVAHGGDIKAAPGSDGGMNFELLLPVAANGH